MTDGYVAKVVGEVDNSPAWGGLRVGVFRVLADGREEQVGEYARNHPHLYDTFHPFTMGERTLALYSPDYTATRIMELPSCRDIGGEEPDEGGFCPIDYFVPTYVVQEWTEPDGTVRRRRINNPAPEATHPETRAVSYVDRRTGEWSRPEVEVRIATPLAHYQFAFVAGCIWGDDESWKIQYLDLSAAAEGRIARDERFGYARLPHGMRLRQAVDMASYLHDDRTTTITLTIDQRFRLDTGEVADPWE